MFELEFQQAECEFLTGDFAAAKERLSSCRVGPRTLLIVPRRLRLQTATLSHGIRTPLPSRQASNAAARGVDWSPHPTKDEVRLEYETDLASARKPTDRSVWLICLR